MHTRDPNIADYGIIGDGQSAALISRAGSLDWLCWPRFDSPPMFSALVSGDQGGRWTISPAALQRTTRHYVDRTNVVETRHVTSSGTCVVTDLMAVASEADKRRMLVAEHELIRLVECVEGHVEIAVCVDPRPNFGRDRARASEHHQLGIRWQVDSKLLILRSDKPMKLGDDGAARVVITLRRGESAQFSLSYDKEGPAVLAPLGDATHTRIARSVAWWRDWIGRARYRGPYEDAVARSALAVKLMSFAPSGAIIAAPTTSLPERIGGDLNWDYRFCWLRDAAFTARSLVDLGYLDEAQAYCSWLLHTTRLTRPELRILYDVYGNAPLREQATSAAGYRGSRPVRVGNAAYHQLQLDTYGEVIDALVHVARVTGYLDKETQSLLRDFGQYVCTHWHLPDQGIWEPREPARHRTHSRLLCWVALDRLLSLQAAGLIGKIDADRMAAHRAAIRTDIEQHGFDPVQQCYTGSFGDAALDAAVLLMSSYGFHPASSPRMISTFSRICQHLSPRPGLLYRYDRSFVEREGTFWICSFWAAEHLALGGGTLEHARSLVDTALSYANDLGLMAEEVDPATGLQLGNFPQAYTHVGLIGTAHLIEMRTRELARPRQIAVGQEAEVST